MSIKDLLRKNIRLCHYIMINIRFAFTQLKKNREIKANNANVILFYLPNGEWFNGGILSIFFLIEKTIAINPNAIVLPIIISNFQRYFKVSWFKNPFFIYNLLGIKSRIDKADNILIHIPECLFEDFCNNVRKYKLEHITKKAVVNILNQNAEVMPPNEVFYTNKSLFKKLTMTLAFKANMDIEYDFLDQKQTFLSAWLYGDELLYTEFESKTNTCIVSPDPHPLKEVVIKKIEKSGIANCLVIKNMPFDDYRSLRLQSKWAISFGEGYDGYFGGVILEGGVGLCVDNPTFSSPFIDSDNLPYNVFSSYEEMLEEIVERMRFFEQNTISRKEIIGTQRVKALAVNSPQLVINNLRQYYQSVGF